MSDLRHAAPPSKQALEQAARGVSAGREAWIDNLRLAIIVGVIGSHVSVMYALDVGWWYEERTASEIARAVLAGVFAPGLLFGMGLMFYVAGWFTPSAFARKGPRRFVIDRLWRLGLPAVIYLLVVNPAMNFVGARAMGEGESVADYFRGTYRDDVEFGVAWFIVALLLFSTAYALWRSRHPVPPNGLVPLSHGDLVKAGVFIAAASFLVRLEFPVLSGDRAWTLNLWEYPQMIALFALGVLARERGWLSDPLPPRLRRSCGLAAAVGVALAALAGAAIAMTDDPDPFLGGLRFEATLIPLIEATLALGMSLWLVDWFRRRANRAGRLTGALGRATFAAYLLHAPITIAMAIALRDLGFPAELKFLGVFVLGAVASFGLGWLFTRSATASRIV